MTPEGCAPPPCEDTDRLFLGITKQPAEPFSFPWKIPFGYLFPFGLQSESNLNGTPTGHQTKYSKNHSKCKKRWKDDSRRNPCSPLPTVTGTVNQIYLIFSTLFVIFKMKMKTLLHPPSQKGQNSVFAFCSRMFTLHILQCKDPHSGRVLRSHQFGSKALSHCSLPLVFCSQRLTTSCRLDFQKDSPISFPPHWHCGTSGFFSHVLVFLLFSSTPISHY